jgi:hypothetical protein
MEVGQGPNWGCGATEKNKYIIRSNKMSVIRAWCSVSNFRFTLEG